MGRSVSRGPGAVLWCQQVLNSLQAVIDNGVPGNCLAPLQMSLKEKAQCETCQLSFIQGLTEDYSLGDSLSVALRNYPEEVGVGGRGRG